MVENRTQKSVQVPIVPDGCVDIVIKNGEIFLVGLMEVASVKTINPYDVYLGIRFHPAVAAALLKKEISVFNDQIIPLQEIDSSLFEELFDICSHKPYDFQLLDDFWEKKFKEVRIDARILAAIEMIVIRSGDIDINLVSEHIGISSRQLERLFRAQVGLTPKRFARTIRFFHTHKYLTKEGIDDLCFKVLEKGYYDQAHFNREYKALTGLKPTSEVMSIFYNT